MDEDIEIINTQTRNEKIKNLFINNKNSLVSILVIIILTLIGYFSLGEYKNKQKIKMSDDFNSIIIDYSKNNKKQTAQDLIKLINKKDTTYSPLSLYFIIDNNLINEKNKINELFNVIIYETSLDDEVRNLNIYKKALYNADNSNEGELLNILNV